MVVKIQFQDLLLKAEINLVKIGIWPSKRSKFVGAPLAVTLTLFSVMVIIKNILNPNAESIENAFTLANGSLTIVVYWLTFFLKPDSFFEFFNSVKLIKVMLTEREEKIMVEAGTELQKIWTAFRWILPASILIKFIQPLLEYLFIAIFANDRTFAFPPTMGIPSEILGEFSTYIIESMVRSIMLVFLMGTSFIFILASLYICTQFKILAADFEDFNANDDSLEKLIRQHDKLLK